MSARQAEDSGPGTSSVVRHEEEAGPPAYMRIVSALADRITSGVYPPGGRLPSGSKLCSEFGVSPMTVRRALSILQAQGLVSGEKGRGNFARSVDLADTDFRLDLRTGEWLDETAEIRLLSASMTRADEKVAATLDVPEGVRVVYLRRAVSYDGNPAMYHTEYIRYDPRRAIVESQLQLTSMHAFFDSGRARGFPRGDLTLTAVNLDAESAQALGQAEGALALCLEHLFRERDGTPVSWGRFLLRAELFRLRAKLGPS